MIKSEFTFADKLQHYNPSSINEQLQKSQNFEHIELDQNGEFFYEFEEEDQEEQKMNDNISNKVQSNQSLYEDIENPLNLYQSAKIQWQGHETQLKEIFKEREEKGQIVLNFHAKNNIKYTDILLQDLEVTEVYLLFFSNQQFSYPNESKIYTNFLEYYMININKEYDISITDIVPQPPEIYSSLYSSNKLQLMDYPIQSTRRISFTHPLEKSLLMPDKIQGKVNENLHWISDTHFILERYLTFSGVKMADTFEPRVIYDVKKVENDILLRCGFYVHFKKKTWLKSKIQKGALEENKKAHLELERMFLEVSDHHKYIREQNKVQLASQLKKSIIKQSKEDQQFLIDSQIQNQIDKEQQEQEDQHFQSKFEYEQQKQILEQSQTQEQIENINQAIKASNSACVIF